MFNQGPQRCPGKELAIFIAQSFLVHYLIKTQGNIESQKIDINNIPQALNPCKIIFKI